MVQRDGHRIVKAVPAAMAIGGLLQR